MKRKISKTKRCINLIAILAFVTGTFVAPVVMAADILIYSRDVFEEKSDSLILDFDDNGTDIALQFGNTLNEQLFWDDSNSQFVFTDDLAIQGNSLTMDSDNTGAGANVSFVAEQGADNNGELRYNATTNRWEISNDGGAFSALSTNSGNTLDQAYDQGGAGSGRVITVDSGSLDLQGTGEMVELGDGTAADSYINFDDGTNRQLGWDDSRGAFSTFNQQLQMRTIQSSSPPFACSASVAGTMWRDTDNGIVYSCDTSNSRNKWLSLSDKVIFGDENGACPSGRDSDSNASCNVDWGNGIGPDGSTNLGFYIPYDITITGVGFSQDNDACTSGSFDLEVRGTASSSDDNTYSGGSSVLVDLATGQSGEVYNSNSLSVDMDGGQYILWGLDNNCGQSIDDWNMVIYFRWRAS